MSGFEFAILVIIGVCGFGFLGYVFGYASGRLAEQDKQKEKKDK